MSRGKFQKLKSFLVIGSSVLCLLQSQSVRAHGGGSPAADEKKVNSPARHPASRPGILAYFDLLKIMDQKIPLDVAIVKCTLNEFASCRGLDIVLFDEHGHQMSKANSGSEGIVGFEGLKEGQMYEAKIQNSKYKGSAVIAPGAAWSLKGDRVTE